MQQFDKQKQQFDKQMQKLDKQIRIVENTKFDLTTQFSDSMFIFHAYISVLLASQTFSVICELPRQAISSLKNLLFLSLSLNLRDTLVIHFTTNIILFNEVSPEQNC